MTYLCYHSNLKLMILKGTTGTFKQPLLGKIPCLTCRSHDQLESGSLIIYVKTHIKTEWNYKLSIHLFLHSLHMVYVG